MKLSSSSLKTAHLEITTRCRLLCVKCERTSGVLNKTHINRDMSLDVIKTYANSEFEKIILCGDFGDAIYHPKILEIISILKSGGKSIHLHTNGSGKSEQWWHQLFKLLDHNDIVWFAIDGLEDTCGLYRKNFTAENFNQLQKIMSIGSNKYNLNIVWIFIAFNFNEHQIEEAKQMALDNNVIFCLRKSSRWTQDDPLQPTDKYKSRNLLVI